MKRVFVVDDERCIADTLVAILRMSGYDALPFYDAQSAICECDRRIPDLVISDVVMPIMTGVEMAILIKQQHPECKVLLFSGQASTKDILANARERGYDFELLAKPVHPKELLARVSGSVDVGNIEVSQRSQYGSSVPAAD